MTATIDVELCISCGWCVEVCPHQIIILGANKKARITEEQKCIECGACALQCPNEAIIVHPDGRDCIKGVIKSKMKTLMKRLSKTNIGKREIS
ncbi:MAG: 4Fe-4S dicluster domain-containing protein [Candidatus Hodarchaeales archaeon]